MVALVLSMGISAADKVTEDFSSLTLNETLNGTKELPSGTWSFSGVQYKNSNSVKCLSFSNTSSTVITPAFDNVAKIGFGYRAGGSNKNVKISYSTDNGSTWTDVETFVIKSSSSTFATYGKKTGTDELTGVKFRVQGDNNVFMNSFTITFSDGGSTTDPDDPTYITEGVWVPVKPIPAATGKTYYISPTGNDNTGDGSEAKPWYNIAVAYAAAEPGDHIICKGGTYKISKYGTDGKLTVRMNKIGTAAKPIVIRCADGEKPVFDFEQQLIDCNRKTGNVGDRGVLLSGDYHIIFGIHMMHAADNAIKLEGNHNRIERCEFSYNLDSGIQLGFGHKFEDTHPGISSNDGSYCCYNDIIDCDSHHNCDCDANYGSDADGFACKMHNGKGNRFIRCRAWRNADDAWDLYETDYPVVLAQCWAWESGNAEDHLWCKDYLDTSASFSGNGNGIKLGGNGTGGSSKGIHYAYDCIAFGCDKSGSVKGFDCNSHQGGHILIGCLAFDNGYDFMFESGGSQANTFFYNNVCLGRQEICVGSDDYNAVNAAASKNGWSNHLLEGASKDDYLSLDEDDALKPRSLDGSYPRKFGRLASDSQLIGAGSATYDIPSGATFDPLREIIADYPFLKHEVNGDARDLGPYEYVPASATAINIVSDNLKSQTSSLKPLKVIKSGRFYIVKGGNSYNAQGQIIY
jgi:hypothetical protein